jgi:hypothetical protein
LVSDLTEEIFPGESFEQTRLVIIDGLRDIDFAFQDQVRSIFDKISAAK